MNNSPDGINLEHTYPKSKGSGSGNAENDMHHLFPTRSPVNTARGNLPFGEINDNETDTWYFLNMTSNSIPSENIDKYSERVTGLFEPQESHKGNVARAMMYFYTMYKEEADLADPMFFESQRSTLCDWHMLDPVDSLEWERTFKIAQYQSNKPNPFVLDSTLMQRSYCSISSVASFDINLLDFKVYPNPNQRETTVEFEVIATSDIHLTIHNVSGGRSKIAFEERLLPGKYTKPIELNQSGVFILKLETDNQVLSRKVVVQK